MTLDNWRLRDWFNKLWLKEALEECEVSGSHDAPLLRRTKRKRLRTEPSKLAVRRMRLAMHPPIISGFPMATSAIIDDPVRLFRLTQRGQEELQRLHRDALW